MGFGDSSAALSALNAVRHFVGLASVDGTLLEANTAALVAGGLRRDEVVGKPFWQARWWAHDPAVQEQLKDAIRRAAKGEPVRYEVEVLAAAAGTALLAIDFSLTPLLDDSGAVRYLVPEGHPLDAGSSVTASLSWADLVAQARSARAEVEELRSLATALAEAHDLDAVAHALQERLPVVLGVEFVNVAVLADDGEVTVHQPVTLEAAIIERWSVLPLSDRTPLTDAIRSGDPVVVRDVDELREQYPSMVADCEAAGLQCLAAYPVLDRGAKVQAAIGLGSETPAAVDMERSAAVLALCGAALQRAIAVDRQSRTTALLDTLIRKAPIGLAFIDRRLRFTMVNDRLAELNGVSPEDHLGLTADEVVPDVADQATPLLRSVLDDQAAVIGVRITGTTPATADHIRTRDESYYPVQTADGEVIGVGAVVEDITDRLATERQIAALLERLRLAIAISRAGIYTWTPDTGVVEWSDEYVDLYGFSADLEPSLEVWLAAVHPDDRNVLVAATERLLTGEDEWDYEFRVQHPTRGERWMHSFVHADRRPDGSVETVVGLHTDITDRKQREIELAELHAHQRSIAERLQTGLLPDVLPAIDGYELAARYLAGTDGLRIGGDWYDVIVLSDDDVALIVGDVVGHDLDAAIAMAQLRNATLGLSCAHTDPASVLADLDQVAQRNPHLLASTIFYGRLDPRTGILRYALGGHHRPVIASPDEPARLHEGPHGTLIGVPSQRPTAELTLAPGQALIVYTDGLIEHRGEPLDAGQRRLLRAAGIAATDNPLDQITRAIVDDVAHPDRPDDIAILTVRRHRRPTRAD